MADDSDDDDDTFVSFGTPVEPLEEDAPRKKPVPIHEQIVTDSQGRRRFHGAFSGGFSAGYFNSVGTKEGWSPSTFVSSRLKKNEKLHQRPEDFMDDEDLSEFGIAPKKIATTGEFLLSRQEHKQQQFAWEQSSGRLKKDAAEKTIIPGVPPLQSLVLPARLSIGVKLLKEMGWRDGQGIGPRVRRTRKKIYGCAPPSDLVKKTYDQKTNIQDDDDEDNDIYASGILFAPKDVKDFVFTPKDDLHGLGYQGIDVSSALVQNPVESSLGISMKRNYFGKASGIKGQAFGVGAFEEEDVDIYITDSMSNYDIELTSESRARNTTEYHGWTGPPKQKVANGLLSIFMVATKPVAPRQYFPPPVIPKDFKSSHTAQVNDKQPSIQPKQQANKSRLSFAERGRILGEKPIPEPKKSVFDYVTSEDRQRLTDVKEQKELKPTMASPDHQIFRSRSSFKPFVKDPQKQERYEQYLKIRAGQKDTSSLPESGLTEWEQEREKEEFARASVLYKPLSAGMAARFTSAKQPDDPDKVYEDVPAEPEADISDQAKAAGMKMFGLMTREKFEWHPDRILCKRFNIPDPYPGSREVGVPKVRREKFSLQDFLPGSLPKPVIERYQPPEVVSEKKKEPLPSLPIGVSVPQPRVTPLKPGSSKHSSTGTADSDKEVKADNQGIVCKTDSKSFEESEPKQRPPMDLFKAIFADSSSDESKESDSDEEPVKASDGNIQERIETSEINVTPKRTMPQLEFNSFAAQSIRKELPPPEIISTTNSLKGGESKTKRENFNPVSSQDKKAEHLKFIPRTKSIVEGGEGKSEKEKHKGLLAISENKDTELPLLKFIPRTKSDKEKPKINPAVSQSEESELPLLEFIPRTKSLPKEGNLNESEKDKIDDDYGPALPSFPNEASEAISSKRHKKTRKHKKLREIGSSDSSEEEQRRRLIKKKKISNSYDKSVCASNDIRLSKNFLLEHYDDKQLSSLVKDKDCSKRSQATSFDKETWKKKAHSTSRKSRTENSNSSSEDSSENEYSYTKSKRGFHDKSNSYLMKKKKKHKKGKRHRDSSRCPEELHYKGKHKKHKRDKKEKDVEDYMTVTEKSQEEPVMQSSLNDSKQILAKLKNIQNLKEQKRMRAADFM